MKPSSKQHDHKVPDILSHFWSIDKSKLLDYFSVDPMLGLTQEQAQVQMNRHGPNRVQKHKSVSLWIILRRQFESIIVALLFIATVIALAIGEFLEGFSILGVLFINSLIGFFTELSAVRSMEALRNLGKTSTKVLRNAELINIDAQLLVPGDIVIFEAGDIVTVDALILESSNLSVNESTFSGESLPVEKRSFKLAAKTPLMNRENTLFKGTSLVRGNTKALAIFTGVNTEIGKIAEIIFQAKEEVTPLEKKLEAFGKKLIQLTLLLTIIIAISGVWAGKPIILMLEIAIALAIAAIPEGLPIVATIALAKGMLRMVKKNALINKLSAVETLGSITTIFTDKTGTLTENNMVVDKMVLSLDEVIIPQNVDPIQVKLGHKSKFEMALKIGLLCNNASLNNVGDPLEIALLQIAAQFGILKEKFTAEFPRVREIPFSSESKMMATIHSLPNQTYLYAVKGAPETVLNKSTSRQSNNGLEPLTTFEKQKWDAKNRLLARQGYRILALAYKYSKKPDEAFDKNLIFLGLVCLRDPPREGIKDDIKSCFQAGIRPVMATGDQVGTAISIAQDIGLISKDCDEKAIAIAGDELGNDYQWDQNMRNRILKAQIFARVSPKQKLDLVRLYQDKGEVVAMTGDGVNDAPALSKSDIGIAMGLRGTQVAKEAADMILKDDHFSTIINAISQGRIIYNNIRLFVIYLLSCNISEVFIVALASILKLPLPLWPLQILFLNLVTDVFPALALGMGEGDHSYMKRPPRDPTLPIIDRSTWYLILAEGALITLSTLAAFLLALFHFHLTENQATTVSFLTLALAQVLHVFNMSPLHSPLFANEVTRNPYVWGAIVLCLFLLGSAIHFPVLAHILKLTPPSSASWSLIFIFGSLAFVFMQGLKACKQLINRYKNEAISSSNF